MRLFVAYAAAALCVAACGAAPEPQRSATSAPTSSQALAINPARIDRARSELPPGYEVADLAGRAAPLALWGFGPDWAADPAHCGTLADPPIHPAALTGWSASGPGGIVYAVVAGGAAPLDPALPAGCGQWTLTAGHTSGTVTLVGAPSVEGASTVGLATEATTVVEGGTETRSHADTFTAYLGDYVAFVTVVTDPGSPTPPLGPDFAAQLLVKTVSALRG